MRSKKAAQVTERLHEFYEKFRTTGEVFRSTGKISRRKKLDLKKFV